MQYGARFIPSSRVPVRECLAPAKNIRVDADEELNLCRDTDPQNLREAQNFINREQKKQCIERIEAIQRQQSPHDGAYWTVLDPNMTATCIIV